MSKQPENPIVLSASDMYAQLKGKIMDGSISLEETKQLYNEFNKITPAQDGAKAIEAINKDLHQEISSEKFHSFASKLVEVEKQIVTEANPIKDTASPEQRKAGMQKRCAEYIRNTSLAKNVVLYECTKNGFAKDISESLLKGDKEGTKKHLANLKIPDYLQEHYSSITQFYKENGNEKGAMTNLVFHVVNTSVTQYGKATIQPGPEYNNFVISLNAVSKEVYSTKIPGSYNKLGAQIPGYTAETVPAKVEIIAKPAPEKSTPTFMERVGSAISSFVNKIKGLVGIKEKPATPAPVGQNIHTVNVNTLHSWLNENKVIILDVREPYEYNEGHINGAINIPLSTILVEIDQIKDIQGKKIVLQCRVGGRSMRACQLLQAEGLEQDVWNLEGGIEAWKEAGYKVQT